LDRDPEKKMASFPPRAPPYKVKNPGNPAFLAPILRGDRNSEGATRSEGFILEAPHMTALTVTSPRQSRARVDAPHRRARTDVTPESIFLRRWIDRQASRYTDLLTTIAASPRPTR
jgi:hypothetical protein